MKIPVARYVLLTLVSLYNLSIQMNARSESVIYSFTDENNDGAVPASGLTFHDGSIFGVTNEGGAYDSDGVLFQLSPDGTGGWQEQAIHVFQGGLDGATPSPVIFDAHGNLYGEAVNFGKYGCRLIFEFSPNGSGWSPMKVLYNFTCGAGGLTFHDGSIFGVTNEGGAYDSDGVLFQLSPDGTGGWQEQAIHVFQGGLDGATPSPVIFDAHGNLYGEAVNFGKYGCRLIFEFSPNGSGWSPMKVLYNFTCGADGGSPSGGLTFDAAGNLYGTTGKGGDDNLCQSFAWDVGCGVIFKLAAGPNGTWTESVLYTFTGQQDGYAPWGGLSFESAGNLYGTTEYYGYYSNGGLGLIFKLSPQSQGNWKYSVLHRFPGGTEGQLPFSNLVVSNGNIYGTTWEGGLMTGATAWVAASHTSFRAQPSSSGYCTPLPAEATAAICLAP